jgi:hypothetical protein
MAAAWSSLKVAALTTVFAVLLGLPTAFARVRGKFPGRELLYADLVAAIVRKKLATAAATILPSSSYVSLDVWRDYLRRPVFPRELWPSQQRICAAGILYGRSCIIQMPTSAGKTRATELILRGGLGCLNSFSASISGASAAVKLPSGVAAG